jgi:hypothetical protein
MYERNNNLNKQYYFKNNKNNKSYYNNYNTSLLNYNKNLNCIKANKGIYTLLKEKMKVSNTKSNLSPFNYKNHSSNNSHRDTSFLNSYENKNRIIANKNIDNLNHKTIWIPERNNNSYKNLFSSTSTNGFRTINNISLDNNNITKTNSNKINSFNKISHLSNDSKNNKYDLFIENMKKKFGADSYIKYNNNNYKKVSLFNTYENNNNISSNKSFNINEKNKSFDYNIVKTINNASNKSNITNYLNTINSHNNYYERKVKSKNISNHIYTNCLINKTFSNNNNTSLNIIENKKINTYAGSNGKNTFFNNLLCFI